MTVFLIETPCGEHRASHTISPIVNEKRAYFGNVACIVHHSSLTNQNLHYCVACTAHRAQYIVHHVPSITCTS